jgi:hypothetical protein
MHNRLIITLVLSLIVVSSVAAFEVSYEVIENRVLPSDTAKYTLTISHELDNEDRFRIMIEEVEWVLRSDPDSFYFSGATIPASSDRTFELMLRSSTKGIGNYLIDLDVVSENTGTTETVQIPVSITSPDGTVGEYLAAVNRLLEFPQQVDPRDGFSVSVNLRNRNPRNITSFDILIESDLFTISESTPLEPFESKRVDLFVELPDDLEPQDVEMVTTFTADGVPLVERFFDDFSIISYRNIEETLERDRGLFRSTRTYTYTNTANAPTVIEGSAQVNLLSRFFSAVRIDGERSSKTITTNSTGTYVTWSQPLEKAETVTVTVVANYAIVFWLVIVALAALIIASLMRSPITIRKDAVVVGVSEGGISEIRVVVHLKNRSARKFLNLSVVDTIPKIAEYVPDKEENMHTLRVYTNQREGSIVKWNLETLERYEERILTYRVKSKLSIVGGLTLPRSLLRFTDDSGQEQVTRSNPERVAL